MNSFRNPILEKTRATRHKEEEAALLKLIGGRQDLLFVGYKDLQLWALELGWTTGRVRNTIDRLIRRLR